MSGSHASKPFGVRLFSGLRDSFKHGYGLGDFKADLMAGAVVGMVAIPLGMALAIASGVPPQHGLYTVIVGGAIVGILGGSRWQISGPTAAFVVILAPIAHKFGVSGLLIAGMMAGVFLMGMGIARLGRLIEFIPYPVTMGFTAGIAVVITTIQLKDFLGMTFATSPETFLDRMVAFVHARGTVSLPELTVGALTLLGLIFWPRVNRKIPAPLVVLAAVSALVIFLRRYYPSLNIATIGSRFNGIPQAAPALRLPWQFPGPDGAPVVMSFKLVQSLMPSALAIAMLGAIESLLSAVVADGMAQTRHDPDAELVGLGVGNIVCPLFGGIAATGAIARTATNIRFGARSPISAIVHAGFVLLAVLLFAPAVSYLPMASLAALLCLVAYNMSEPKHFVHILKVGPRGDVAVLLTCFGFTVIFDMVIGVMVGVVLAAMLFMRRVSSQTSGYALVGSKHIHPHEPLPQSIMLYEIAGPLFFGAAERAMGSIAAIGSEVKAVVFLMNNVPLMDMTGLIALETAITGLARSGREICLVGVREQPKRLLLKSDITNGRIYHVEIQPSVDDAVRSLKSALKLKAQSENPVSQKASTTSAMP